MVRTVLRVEVHVVLRFPPCAEPEHEPLSPVGVDKGLATRLTLSDGTSVAARDPDLGNIKRRQRALSRAKQGSRSRSKKRKALARAWRKESESARMADFRLADRLVTSYDAVAVEDLNVAGTAPLPTVLTQDGSTALGFLRPHTGTQSRESWCPLREGKPRQHHHRPLPLRAPPADAPGDPCLQLRGLWDSDRPRPQRCEEHLRPGRMVLGSGGAHPRRSAHNKLLPGDRTPPNRGGTRADATETYRLMSRSFVGTHAHKPLSFASAARRIGVRR